MLFFVAPTSGNLSVEANGLFPAALVRPYDSENSGYDEKVAFLQAIHEIGLSGAVNRPLYVAYNTIPSIWAEKEGLSDMLMSQTHSVSANSREETLRRIRELSVLENGWDGYGGYSPSRSACDQAQRLIEVLALSFPYLESPDVSPTSNGTITFSWETKAGDACIEVGDQKFSAYVRRQNDFIPFVGDYSNLGRDQLQSIWEYLYQ
jgi:hypothetical protein